jgi:signal transduction histidine kinase
LILIGTAGFFLGMIGATLLSRRISRPIKKLVEGTIRISKGDFSHKIEIGSGDEIGDLARSFNEMSSRLLATRDEMEEAHKKLIQAEKLASIGKLAATIAHEIRNPLTSVKLNIQKVVGDNRLGPVEQEHLAISQEGIAQIEKFIKELLNFTRVSGLQVARFPVSQILEESVKMVADCFQQKKIVIERKVDERLPEVLVDGDKMRQVILNVLRNACEAIEETGKISLSASLAGDGRLKKIRIRISDSGCGIPEKDWENIFEPFFTTKPSGFGLGLANARKIVEQHKGTIRVVKKRSPGTSFEILIPCEGEP